MQDIQMNNLIPEINPEMKDIIDAMTQEQMAAKWRFAPIGDPMFVGEVGEYFTKRFKELGGMTVEISKRLGWW